jgi:hypothetical protein
VIGRTRDREGIIGGHYRETRGTDGGVKSISRDREGIFGDHYSESTGGSSNTTHQTRSHDNLLDGKKHRETW